MSDPDPTIVSFPTYADLTQTKGWRGGAAPIGDTLDAAVLEESAGATRYVEPSRAATVLKSQDFSRSA